MPQPERYAGQVLEMTKIWESEGYFKAQMGIWGAQSEARHELYGEPTAEELMLIKDALVLTPDEVVVLNEAKGHETNKLLKHVQSKLPDTVGNYLHRGNTSSDVLDTSLALQIKESIGILQDGFNELGEALLDRSDEHKKTLQIGRSHTQQALPQTFERQMLGWYAEVMRGVERFERANQVISYGKLSGEIGTNVFIEPELEEKALEKLGLKPDEAPTQVISRDRHAEVLTINAINAGTLARIATNVRLLSMTEVGEVREPFEAGSQEGSSSMPHKRNPELSERVVGLNRRIRGAALEELDAMILWLERDISHSSTERFTFPDSFGGLAYATKLITHIVKNLEVDPERMMENVERSFGAIYSGRLMNMLLDKSAYPRTEAYNLVKELALKALKDKTLLYELAVDDPRITEHLSSEELEEAFDPKFYLHNIDVAKKRLGLSK